MNSPRPGPLAHSLSREKHVEAAAGVDRVVHQWPAFRVERDPPDHRVEMTGHEVERMCRRARGTGREGGGGCLGGRRDQLVGDVGPRSAAATVGFLRGDGE